MAQILSFPQYQEGPFCQLAWVSAVVSTYQFLVVLANQDRVEVRRCASCLLEPMPGDEVILLSISGRFYLTHVVTQANPKEQVIASPHALKFRSQHFMIEAKQSQFNVHELKLNTRRLFAKIPLLQAVGGQWLTSLKKSFFKSKETVQDLGHYVLGTDSMHEVHQSVKTLKAPLITEKTQTHHISTEKFLLD